jgi:hypothetical protein
MITERPLTEPDTAKLGHYWRQISRRLQKRKMASLDFDERISVANGGWYFDRQPILVSEKNGGYQPTGALAPFMTYAVNEYGGVDNLLRFMDIKVDFVLSLS